jgi:two-component system cell cycle sensor histidine kinase/response regulator CckA
MVGRLIGGSIQLTVDISRRPAPVLADRGQLEQVLINLVVNARDAMPHGGTLAMRTRVVQLTAADALRLYPIKPATYVRFSVADTGVGMPPDVQARVFEPFFTTKEPGKGTGIGLSTVYGIIKQSGGFIFLTSEQGKGSTFDVYLPLSNVLTVEGASAGEQDAPPAPAPVPGATVLLVEDYSRVRLLARKVLARQGYRVLTAQSGAEALALAHGHEGAIDILVTDVVMPGMSGPELARYLHETHPDTAVVYMSGYAGDVLGRQGLDPEAAPFLEKPFTPGALSRKVREVLTRRVSRG